MELFHAIREGNHSLARTLLQQQPDLLHQRDARGTTPLILATYLGDLTMTDLLLEFQADPNHRDQVGNTALMGICFKGNLVLAERLIEAGADINARNTNDATALIFAATFGQEPIVHLLLEKGADPSLKDNRQMTAYDHAKIQEFTALAELLAPA